MKNVDHTPQSDKVSVLHYSLSLRKDTCGSVNEISIKEANTTNLQNLFIACKRIKLSDSFQTVSPKGMREKLYISSGVLPYLY